MEYQQTSTPPYFDHQPNSFSGIENFDPGYVTKLIIIYDLNDPKYGLKKELKIMLEITEDGYVAYYKSLKLFAFGDCLQEAVSFLKRDIIDLYIHLITTPNSKLGVGPLACKAHVQDIVKVRGNEKTGDADAQT